MWFKKRKSPEETAQPYRFVPSDVSPLLHYMREQCGIDLLTKKETPETHIRIFCERRQIESFAALLCLAREETDLWQVLLNLLTVNESYFFRERRQLDHAVA